MYHCGDTPSTGTLYRIRVDPTMAEGIPQQEDG